MKQGVLLIVISESFHGCDVRSVSFRSGVISGLFCWLRGPKGTKLFDFEQLAI
jgi:hypothetical protein